MTDSNAIGKFNQELDRSTSGSDDELVQFATRLNTTITQSPPADIRRDMWMSIVASQPRAERVVSGAGPLSQPLLRARSPRSNGFLPQGLPAPAVLLFGVVIAVLFAVSGFGSNGDDMVTPTVHAEQVATEVATPATFVPTIAIINP